MTTLTGKTIAVLATDGFEQSELTEPKRRLEEMGAKVEVISLKGKDSIRGWDQKDWGDSVKVDKQLDQAKPSDYDALVLPGGVINPDTLRRESSALDFIKAVAADDKPVAAICHGPWLLAETGPGQGSQADFVELAQDRPVQCGQHLGRPRGRGRRQHHHQPQSRRYPGLQQGDRGSAGELTARNREVNGARPSGRAPVCRAELAPLGLSQDPAEMQRSELRSTTRS